MEDQEINVTVNESQPIEVTVDDSQPINISVDDSQPINITLGDAIVNSTFLSLIDTPNSYSGNELKGIRVNSGGNAVEFYTTSDSDEKIKISSNDTTAGYVEDKFIAGTGIGLTVNDDGSNETITISNTQTSAEWGNIDGTITDQTDLVNYIDSEISDLTSSLTTQYLAIDGSNANQDIDIGAYDLKCSYLTVEDESGKATLEVGALGDFANLRLISGTNNNYALVMASNSSGSFIDNYPYSIQKPITIRGRRGLKVQAWDETGGALVTIAEFDTDEIDFYKP